MNDLNSVIEFAEKAEDYDIFDIIKACRKLRKLGEGTYSKMILTGKLDFCDYGAGFINFEICHCYQPLEKQHYSRIWFGTIDDGDMGAWVPFSSKEEVIAFNDKFAGEYLKDLSIFPTLDELNKQLRPFGIYISYE